MNKISRTLALLSLGLPITCSYAQATKSQQLKDATRERLKFALVLTRHGVRSPTWSNSRLDEYAREPWPKWPVAPGLLTPHGKQLMSLFGAYYRVSFAATGLIFANGCPDAGQIYIDADSDERTVETGRGLAEGLAPGCNLTVHSLPTEQRDPLFHPVDKPTPAETQLALAALADRIGGDPSALLPAYRAPLQAMRQVLFACEQLHCEIGGDKKDLLAIKPSLTLGSGDHLVELKGPLSTAATFAENLQLEYLEGLPDAQVGWGRVDEGAVRNLMSLHAASSDIVQRTPYIAHAQAAELVQHILHTMQQAEQRKTVDGATGPPSDRLVVLVGHDTNIANIAAILDAHWLVNGYRRDDAAPGGALVFELWGKEGSPDAVRIYYTVQTPRQMRNAASLSMESPPARATVFLPACSSGDHDAPCSWSDFEHLLERADAVEN